MFNFSSVSNSSVAPFIVPQRYKSLKILSISAYNEKPNHFGLKLIDGYHCFCTIQL